jgi:hypothetical protein
MGDPLIRKKVLITIAALVIVVIGVSLFAYLEFTELNSPSAEISFTFQPPDSSPLHFGYIYQNGTFDYNSTAFTNSTCLLYNIGVINTGKVALHNVTLYIDSATAPLLLGRQNDTDNFNFVPFNDSFLPVSDFFGTVNPKEWSYGNNMEIAVKTPNQAGAYQIQCRLESTEESFPFNITINAVS